VETILIARQTAVGSMFADSREKTAMLKFNNP